MEANDTTLNMNDVPEEFTFLRAALAEGLNPLEMSSEDFAEHLDAFLAAVIKHDCLNLVPALSSTKGTDLDRLRDTSVEGIRAVGELLPDRDTPEDQKLALSIEVCLRKFLMPVIICRLLGSARNLIPLLLHTNNLYYLPQACKGKGRMDGLDALMDLVGKMRVVTDRIDNDVYACESALAPFTAPEVDEVLEESYRVFGFNTGKTSAGDDGWEYRIN